MRLIKLVALVVVIPLLLAACQDSADAPTALDGRALQPADAAIVINQDGSCGMAGSDAAGNFIFGGIGEVNRIVENDNWAQLDCKGSGITNDSGMGQSFRGLLCGIGTPASGFVFTTDTHATVSASGQATLSCKYEK